LSCDKENNTRSLWQGIKEMTNYRKETPLYQTISTVLMPDLPESTEEPPAV